MCGSSYLLDLGHGIEFEISIRLDGHFGGQLVNIWRLRDFAHLPPKMAKCTQLTPHFPTGTLGAFACLARRGRRLEGWVAWQKWVVVKSTNQIMYLFTVDRCNYYVIIYNYINKYIYICIYIMDRFYDQSSI